jgi:hypothetical protein
MNDGNPKEPTFHNRSILEEIHKLRLKPGVFFASQDVARMPIRFISNVLATAPPTFLCNYLLGCGVRPAALVARQNEQAACGCE